MVLLHEPEGSKPAWEESQSSRDRPAYACGLLLECEGVMYGCEVIIFIFLPTFVRFPLTNDDLRSIVHS